MQSSHDSSKSLHPSFPLLALHHRIPEIRHQRANKYNPVQRDSEPARICPTARPSRDFVRSSLFRRRVALDALQGADELALQDLAGFVGVAYVFEGFGCVLACYVEEDFFAAAAKG